MSDTVYAEVAINEPKKTIQVTDWKPMTEEPEENEKVKGFTKKNQQIDLTYTDGKFMHRGINGSSLYPLPKEDFVFWGRITTHFLKKDGEIGKPIPRFIPKKS
jgi:hypothetical protein